MEGPSGITRQSEDEELLQEFLTMSINQDVIPKFGRKRMEREPLGTMFAGYVWLSYEGRRLVRDEVTGMLHMEYHGIPYQIAHSIFDKFEDPTDPLRLALEALRDAVKAALTRDTGRCYQRYLRQDSVAKQIEVTLKGFTGRLPSLKIDHGKSILNNAKTRDDQFFVIHTLRNSCVDFKGQNLTASETKTIYCHHFKIPVRGSRAAIFENLGDAHHAITKKVAACFTEYQRVAVFFRRKAHEIHLQYDPGAQCNVPSQPIASIAPQADPSTAATFGLENLSVAATSSASNQRTRPPPLQSLVPFPEGSVQPKVLDVTEEQRREAKAEETQQTDAAEVEGKGKGKGKGPANPRRSKSPEVEGKGKGKGPANPRRSKSPEVEGKGKGKGPANPRRSKSPDTRERLPFRQRTPPPPRSPPRRPWDL